MAQEAYERAIAEFGTEVETTAEDALLAALWRAHGTVLFFRDHVRKLTDEQMTYGTQRITRTVRPNGQGGTVVEDVTVARAAKNIWVQMLQEAERHLLAVGAAIATHHIEQRKVALAEEQGQLLYTAMGLILERYGIPNDDPELPVIVGEVIDRLTA